MNILFDKRLTPEIAGQRLTEGDQSDCKHHNANQGEAKCVQKARERHVFLHLLSA